MRGRARREPRLDPVRWRRPGRSTLLRAALVAALMVTAALVLWAGPGPTSTDTPGPAATDPRSGANSARRPPDAGRPSDAERPPDAGRLPDAGRASQRPAVPSGSVGVPIRLAEPTALTLVHPGDHVDVFRVPGGDASPQVIATAALVLGVTGADDPGTGGLLVALTPAQARLTVTTSPAGYAVLIRPDG